VSAKLSTAPNPTGDCAADVAALGRWARDFSFEYARSRDRIVAPSAHFNVKDYGAKGDGDTDDIAAIVATRNAAVAAGNGTVYFPPGNYRVTSAIGLRRGVNWLGAGREASYITADTASQNLFTNDSGSTVKRMFMRDLYLTVGAGLTCGTALDLQDVSRSDFRFIEIYADPGAKGYKVGVKIDTQTEGYYNVFDNCRVMTIGGVSTYYAYWLTGASSNGANSTQIIGGEASSDDGTAIYLEQGNNVGIYCVAIEGDTLKGIHVKGENGVRDAQATIIGCRLESDHAGPTGIHLDSDSSDCTLIGNFYDVTTDVTNAGSRNLIVEQGILQAASFTNATRGAAGTAGRIIFNSDDGQLNIDTGSDWTLPNGDVT